MTRFTKQRLSVLLLLLGFAWSTPASAQTAADTASWTLSPAFHLPDWPGFVRQVEQTYSVTFFYESAVLDSLALPPIAEETNLLAWLRTALQPHGLQIAVDRAGNIFVTQGPAVQTQLSENIYPTIRSTDDRARDSTANPAYLATEQTYVAETLTIGDKKEGLRQTTVTLSGHLRNAETGEPIIGGSLYLLEAGTGTSSDENGYYRLSLRKGFHSLRITDLNSEEQVVKLEMLSSGRHDFLLYPQAITLKDVVVVSDKYDAVQNTRMGFERLTTKSVKEIPLVLGERDIVKIATLLPGVQSVGEGSAGFNVRGSPADQNMFYIDEVPVYNTSHLFGFFSAFNSEAVSEFTLSKSNIPAQFGGRLASIFDITALEGDKTQYKVRGGISPITGRLLFEGPIQKNKSSAMIGLRSTYSNWILRLIKNQDFKNTDVFFGDAVAKLSFDLDPRNKLRFFGYYSLDDIDFAERVRYDQRNLGGSLIWSRFFNDKHSLDLALVYSKLGLVVTNEETPVEAYRQDNALVHKEAKLTITLRPNPQHDISIGGNAILYNLDRGGFLPAGPASLLEARDLGAEQGLEAGLYVSDEWDLSPALAVVGGLRYNRYSYLGPQTVYTYRDDLPKDSDSVLDTLRFAKGEAIKTYADLDYRLGVRWNPWPNWSFKASYNRLHQYIFLLSNTIALAPADKWKLTDYHIRPMQADQWSLGLYTQLPRLGLEFSVEGYQKLVRRLVEFKDGADLLINEQPERDVLQGRLDAYGLECMLKKPNGRFNGWLNYTYARSTVLADGPPGERINFGQRYPSNYDKPHQLNVVANYRLIRRVNFSANLVYATGRPSTFPAAVYYQNDIQLIEFTKRNEYRLPDYFRIDLSLSLEGNLKAEKLLHGNFVFSVYNVTGRHNAYNVYFQSTDGFVRGYKVSIFAAPIFSISYNFKFGNYDS